MAMAAEGVDISTPIRGEPKQRRLRSPLQEMDGEMDGLDPVRDGENTPLNLAQPLTLASMATLLDRKLAPITDAVGRLQLDVGSLNTTVVNNKTEADHQIQSMKADIDHLKHQLNETMSNMAPSTIGTPRTEDIKIKTAVLGGLSSMSSVNDAWFWLSNKMWDLYGPQPTEVYSKGEFRGIIFAKFDSEEKRDSAVKLLRQSSLREGGNAVWAKPDQVLHQRTLRSFAFGAKYLLTKWGDKGIWADPDTGSVLQGGKDGDSIITASISGQTINVTYATGWEKYLTDEAHPEFKDMLKLLEDKLGNSTDPGKGVGKGHGKAEKGKGKTQY